MLRYLTAGLFLGLVAPCIMGQPSTEADTAKPVMMGAVELKPKVFEGYDQPLLHGEWEVFENREAMKGRKIPMQIVIAKATGPNPKPDPLFHFSGGPGQGSAEIAPFIVKSMAPLRVERDLVFIDQRGTGGSNSLKCPELGPADKFQTYLRPMYPDDYVKNCRELLEKKADLRMYTTANLVDDIDEIRAALGYDQINLFGGSYGTRASLTYMRRHPDSVRSATLIGPAPPSAVMPGSFAAHAQRALDRLVTDCAADENCNKMYPRFKENLARVLAEVKKGPVKATVKNPENGQTETVSYDYNSLITGLRAMLYSTRNGAGIPAMIEMAAGGDYMALAMWTAMYLRGIGEGISDGLYLSTTCAEDVPYLDMAKEKKAAEGTFLGDYRLVQQANGCRLWPRGKIPEDTHQSIVSDIPTLILSGDVDPVTPPANGDEAVKNLANGLHIAMPNAAHGAGARTPCGRSIIAFFLKNASVKDLDTSCSKFIQRPPFQSIEELKKRFGLAAGP
ncbi:MAG: alpha/beta hydrolase [Acidobacteriota bacterium]|nr:alpha/beta hydrolase [Acidobacteriota bacterium]